MAKPSTILAPNGEPFQHTNGHSPRPALVEALLQANGRTAHRPVKASYDAARDTPDMRNYWTNADALDSDSANSKAARSKLVPRSRYEVGNNGYVDGMVQTHANFLIGTGPALRMQTRSPGFNAMVEAAWLNWAKAILLRRKLWCMAHAKVQDGEAFGILRNNPGIADPTQLDLVLIETEQCTTPNLPWGTAGYIDGIRFDEFGNPIYYDILPRHPGAQWGYQFEQPEQVPAAFVLHWFTLRRPGQHRAVPEFRSTLNVGAASRRFREATVAAAEVAADYATILKTNQNPEGGADPIRPLTEVEFDKRMMVAAPMGWEPVQMDGKHPNATYEEFHSQQINEQARPKSMPQNVATCNSAGYNFASGKLDHGTYFLTLDVERQDAIDLVLDRTFPHWFQRAALANGWSVNPTPSPPHTWDWPRHPVGDIRAQANANDSNLRNGSQTLSSIYADAGKDFEDEVQVMARDYGVTVEEMRSILLKQIFSAAAKQDAAERQATADAQDAAAQLQESAANAR